MEVPAHRATYPLALSLLGYTVLVILWGAFVRVTGSGAGCADHWPLCNGEWIPRAERVETLIELTHRITSALDGLLSLVVLWWARRVTPAGSGLRRWAGWGVFLMITEGAVGALLVKAELVVDNASVARAFAIALHLTNTMLLLGAQVMTVHFARGGGRLALRGGGPPIRPLLIGVGLTLLVGVTGAITALGDTLFPASSIAEGIAQDLSPTAHFLVRLRVMHPVVAVLSALFIVHSTLDLRTATTDAEVRRWAGVVAGLFVAQIGFGFVNLWLLAPAAMQILHLLLADMVWISLVALCATTLAARAALSELPEGNR